VVIGERIRLLRRKLGLTQGELADRCELTKGYISQLEHDLTSPSIVTLGDILTALGSSMSAFFAASEQDKVVYREADRFEKEGGGVVTRWLVPNAQKNEMEPILTTLQPGAATEADQPHEGEEFGYVLKGAVTVTLGNAAHKAKAGDSFYYTADRVHALKNEGKTPAVVLWVSAPPNF
jgi:transcriptional regulator with XRE-family HTH domain